MNERENQDMPTQPEAGTHPRISRRLFGQIAAATGLAALLGTNASCDNAPKSKGSTNIPGQVPETATQPAGGIVSSTPEKRATTDYLQRIRDAYTQHRPIELDKSDADYETSFMRVGRETARTGLGSAYDSATESLA